MSDPVTGTSPEPGAWFRQIVELAPNALVLVDAAGRIALVNAETERLFGYAREELLGESVERLVPDHARAQHAGERAAFLAEPRARAMGAGRDLFARRADGGEFPVEIGLNPLDTDEGPMVLAAIVDITERKQAEELIRASLHDKEVLLQEVYHRVKNNLQVLVSLMSLQERALSDPGARDALRQSANRVKAMSLVHEMLYRSDRLSNLDLGRYLAALVEHLMDTYDARGSGIVIDTQIEAIEVPLEVAIPLGLVINELVSNCLKLALEQRAECRLILRARRDGQGRIELTVGDDGSGIAARVDAAETGTFGLQVVRALTRQLGGEVSFSSGAHGTEIMLRV